MNTEFLGPGYKIPTVFGNTITVEEYLGEGGQGTVYIVDYNGKKKALKWYKKHALGTTPQEFYNNLQENIKRGKPSSEFLWPEDITHWADGTFGYIMDLRPEGYYELSEFMLRHVSFSSFKTMVSAALHIVSAFRILHNAGYSYQDMNDGNFFINPQNGRVLICDNDNVAPDGTQTGILGKPRYMAPEIVLRKNMPDSLSDRFSMALILYILFCLNHPLEGKRYLEAFLTPEVQEKLYGSEPLFMMDPDDTRNEPHPKIHQNSIKMWSVLPGYMKQIFLNAFSQKALTKPSARPSEKQWIDVLTRFRCNITSCICGNEIFLDLGAQNKCDECQAEQQIPYKLKMSSYDIPILPGSYIFRCQTGVCDVKDALIPVAQIVLYSSGQMGIKNRSSMTWNALTTKGISRKVAPNEVIPVKEGIAFKIANEKITIKSN